MRQDKSPTGDAADRGTLVLSPDGITLSAPIGTPVLFVLQEGGVSLSASCGGHGRCGECRIRFLDRPPDPTPSDRAHIEPDDLRAGWRLACAHPLSKTVRIEVPRHIGELANKARSEIPPAEALDPIVRAVSVHLEDPTRSVAPPPAVQVRNALPSVRRLSLHAIRRAAQLRKETRFDTSAIFDGNEVLDLQATPAPAVFGLAVDVGTTTLAVHLFDLLTGRRRAAAAGRNPQRRFGADVISRIGHVRTAGNTGLEALRNAVVGGIHRLIDRTISEASIRAESIYAATIVGNPTMIHLLLGVDPRGIDVSPYVPAFLASIRCRGSELSLPMHPRALTVTLPAVSAYIGADIVAGVLSTGLVDRRGASLFLDVGTNGEIVLARDGRLMACSTAAGPALEGASIAHGMPALDGAIASVRVEGGRIGCRTIGDASPIGLCGTGLVSAVAKLRAAGVIDDAGRLRSLPPLADRLEGEGKDRRFRLSDHAPSVCLHQRDVREFQLAKAAVRSGIEVLLERANLSASALDRVLIGGAFSVGLSGADLMTTGFLPPVDPSVVRAVGDTAGRGAASVLLDRRRLEDAELLVDGIQYVELSGDRRFAELYVDQMRFPVLPAAASEPPRAHDQEAGDHGR